MFTLLALLIGFGIPIALAIHFGGKNASTKAIRRRSLLVMTLLAGTTFTVTWFGSGFIREAIATNAITNLAMSLLMLPVLAIFITLFVSVFAVPTALMFERFAPRSVKDSLEKTTVIGAILGGLIAVVCALLVNAAASVDNPFALNVSVASVGVCAALAGSLAAFYWAKKRGEFSS